MSGLITGLLNLSLIFVLTLSVLIERGQRQLEQRYQQPSLPESSMPWQEAVPEATPPNIQLGGAVTPEDILSSPRPERFRPNGEPRRFESAPGEGLAAQRDTEPFFSAPFYAQKFSDEPWIDQVKADAEQLGDFIQSWLRRLSIELYSVVQAERGLMPSALSRGALSGDDFLSDDHISDEAVFGQVGRYRPIKADPRLMTTIRIPAALEPVVMDSL